MPDGQQYLETCIIQTQSIESIQLGWVYSAREKKSKRNEVSSFES